MIGGAPAIGKSTAARALAHQFKFDYLGTDTIRRIARSVSHKHTYPGIHFFLEKDPEKYFFEHTVDDFIRQFCDEAGEIWPVVQDLITSENPALRDVGVVIEGVNLMPTHVGEFAKYDLRVRYVLLEANHQTIKNNIMQRGLWAKTVKAKEKEVAYVCALNDRLVQQAQQTGVEVVAVEPYDSLADRLYLVTN